MMSADPLRWKVDWTGPSLDFLLESCGDVFGADIESWMSCFLDGFELKVDLLDCLVAGFSIWTVQ